MSACKSESAWLAVGALTMLGALIYLQASRSYRSTSTRSADSSAALERSPPTREGVAAAHLSSIVVLLALCSYSAMFVASRLYAHAQVTAIRYLEWAITTPLLLVELARLTGRASRERRRDPRWLSTVIALDVAMIALGAVAVYASDVRSKVAAFVASTACMLAIFYFLFGPGLFGPSERRSTDSRYDRAVLFTTCVWALYPVVWLLGDHGLGYVSIPCETLGYVVLDSLAKPAFAVIFANVE